MKENRSHRVVGKGTRRETKEAAEYLAKQQEEERKKKEAADKLQKEKEIERNKKEDSDNNTSISDSTISNDEEKMLKEATQLLMKHQESF